MNKISFIFIWGAFATVAATCPTVPAAFNSWAACDGTKCKISCVPGLELTGQSAALEVSCDAPSAASVLASTSCIDPFLGTFSGLGFRCNSQHISASDILSDLVDLSSVPPSVKCQNIGKYGCCIQSGLSLLPSQLAEQARQLLQQTCADLPDDTVCSATSLSATNFDLTSFKEKWDAGTLPSLQTLQAAISAGGINIAGMVAGIADQSSTASSESGAEPIVLQEDCGQLTLPSHLTAVCSGTAYLDSCLVSCAVPRPGADDGTQSTGRRAVCSNAGEWVNVDGDLPPLQCDSVASSATSSLADGETCPTAPAGTEASVVCTGNAVGDECVYTCNGGTVTSEFEMTARITCNTGGQWSGPGATCYDPFFGAKTAGGKRCNSFANTPDQLQAFLLDGQSPRCDNIAAFGCCLSLGASLLLDPSQAGQAIMLAQLMCGASSVIATPCPITVSCPATPPDLPPHGTVRCTGTGEGDTCAVECAAGYSPSRVQTITCGSNGQWTAVSEDFTCQTVGCEALPAVAHASRSCVDGVGGANSYGTVCTNTCNPGFERVSRANSIARQCLASGQWTGDPFLCQRDGCLPPTLSPGAVSNCTDGGAYGASCHAYCGPEYTQSLPLPPSSGEDPTGVWWQCSALDKQWKGPSLVCAVKQCNMQTRPALNFTCPLGSYAKVELGCNGDGTWRADQLLCQPCPQGCTACQDVGVAHRDVRCTSCTLDATLNGNGTCTPNPPPAGVLSLGEGASASNTHSLTPYESRLMVLPLSNGGRYDVTVNARLSATSVMQEGTGSGQWLPLPEVPTTAWLKPRSGALIPVSAGRVGDALLEMTNPAVLAGYSGRTIMCNVTFESTVAADGSQYNNQAAGSTWITVQAVLVSGTAVPGESAYTLTPKDQTIGGGATSRRLQLAPPHTEPWSRGRGLVGNNPAQARLNTSIPLVGLVYLRDAFGQPARAQPGDVSITTSSRSSITIIPFQAGLLPPGVPTTPQPAVAFELIPRVLGDIQLSVQWKGQNLQSSPLTTTVSSPTCVGLDSHETLSVFGTSCVCVVGHERSATTGKCVPCRAGSYRDSAANDGPCMDCETGYFSQPGASSCTKCTQQGVACAAGQGVVLPGYWVDGRSSGENGAAMIVPCAVRGGCGSVENSAFNGSEVSVSTCAKGYEGVACARCIEGYAGPRALCMQCPSTGVAYGMWAALLICQTGFLLYALRRQSSDSKRRSKFVVFVRILINHLQTTTLLIRAFEARYTRFVARFLAFYTASDGLSSASLAADCALNLGLFERSLFVVGFVLTLSLVLPLIWGAMACAFGGKSARQLGAVRDASRVPQEMIALGMMLLYIGLPGAVSESMRIWYFFPRDMDQDGGREISGNLQGNSSDSLFPVVSAVAAVMLLSTLICSYMAYRVLNKHIHDIHRHTREVRRLWLFLYEGFDDASMRGWWYEITTIVRKVGLACVLVASATNPVLQWFFACCWIMSCLTLHVGFLPYTSRMLNNTETLSLMTSLLVAMLSGMYFEINGQVDYLDAIDTLMAVVVGGALFVFLVLFGKSISPVFRELLRDIESSLRVKLGLESKHGSLGAGGVNQAALAGSEIEDVQRRERRPSQLSQYRSLALKRAASSKKKKSDIDDGNAVSDAPHPKEVQLSTQRRPSFGVASKTTPNPLAAARQQAANGASAGPGASPAGDNPMWKQRRMTRVGQLVGAGKESAEMQKRLMAFDKAMQEHGSVGCADEQGADDGGASRKGSLVRKMSMGSRIRRLSQMPPNMADIQKQLQAEEAANQGPGRIQEQDSESDEPPPPPTPRFTPGLGSEYTAQPVTGASMANRVPGQGMTSNVGQAGSGHATAASRLQLTARHGMGRGRGRGRGRTAAIVSRQQRQASSSTLGGFAGDEEGGASRSKASFGPVQASSARQLGL